MEFISSPKPNTLNFSNGLRIELSVIESAKPVIEVLQLVLTAGSEKTSPLKAEIYR